MVSFFPVAFYGIWCMKVYCESPLFCAAENSSSGMPNALDTFIHGGVLALRMKVYRKLRPIRQKTYRGWALRARGKSLLTQPRSGVSVHESAHFLFCRYTKRERKWKE